MNSLSRFSDAQSVDFPFQEHPHPERSSLSDYLSQNLATVGSLTERLQMIANTISGRIVFTTSLGIEDQVLLHAIVESKVDIYVATLDTGRHFPETYDILASSQRRFGNRIKVYMPDATEVETLVQRDGIYGFRDSVDNRKACCGVRKVNPLQRALSGAAGWITGLRRDQSSTRETTPFASVDEDHALIKINPLADWSLDQIEAYIAANDVPISILHRHGFPSIGCQPCTRAVAPGESIRAGRWWWENEDHKECGLHNRPSFQSGAQL